MTQKQLMIESGPSEMDLAFSLFRQQPVYFTIDGCDVWVNILGIEAEDGSGKSWNIKGYINKSTDTQKFPIDKEFYGWFDYRQHRQGWIKLKDSPEAIPEPDEVLSIKIRTRQFEKELIIKALRKTNGDRAKAAILLEITPRVLHFKMKDLGMKV